MSSPLPNDVPPEANAKSRLEVEPKGNLLKRMRRFAPYFGTFPGTWLMVAISAVVAAATEPLIPALLKPLLDRGFQQGELEIWTVPTSLLLLFGVRGLAGYLSQIGLSRITNVGLLSMRKAMFEKLLDARMDLFETQSSSALSNTVVFEVQTGATMLVNSLLSLTRNGLTLIALTGYLFYLNWKLTMIVAAIFPAVAWVMRTLTSRLHWLTKANQDATDELAYVVEENVLAHREVRLYNAQSSQRARFQKLGDGMQRLALKSTIAGAAMTPMTQMLAAVALSAVISVALIQSSTSGTSVGGFVAFVTAMLMIVAPIRQLSEVSSPITRGLVALERGLALIEGIQSETGGGFALERSSGAIDYQDISVRYAGSTNFAVRCINLNILPGETVALVGASGSGKTTLANLLPRFVEIESGKLLLDGHDVREWTLPALRKQFAYVSQNVVMINDTIAANVALGVSVDRERVIECLQVSNLSSFIEAAKNGIDTLVGHNALQLSGGQRQRLAIARALYKNAPILILDEATSALDSESERAIQESLQALMRNRTTLVIAHRLSTVQHADRIVVLADGGIAEMGTHSELITLNGPYSRLYMASQQSGGTYFA